MPSLVFSVVCIEYDSATKATLGKVALLSNHFDLRHLAQSGKDAPN